jgi:hypothetical protein
MRDDGRQPHARRRFGRAAARATTAAARMPESDGAVDRILALPRVDRALGRLLGHPRALQIAGILIGVMMVALTLRPLLWPVAAPAEAAVPVSGPSIPVPATAPLAQPAAYDSKEEVLNVVAEYNQASIAAAVLGRSDPMAPYLAPDGKTWEEVQAEYQRRATRGETHNPALTRWGVLQIVVDGDAATVETQEQWDDVISVGGQVVSSRRGILTRNSYTLRHSPSLNRWQITNVATTTLIN